MGAVDGCVKTTSEEEVVAVRCTLGRAERTSLLINDDVLKRWRGRPLERKQLVRRGDPAKGIEAVVCDAIALGRDVSVSRHRVPIAERVGDHEVVTGLAHSPDTDPHIDKRGYGVFAKGLNREDLACRNTGKDAVEST